MKNELIPFNFEEKKVRVVVIDGEPWFAARDVGDALGIEKVRNVVRSFPESEKGAHTVGTLGGKQEMIILNEPGLYRLIFQSRKPEAERFKTWVFETVLPQIRRTGGYNAGAAAFSWLELQYLDEENRNLKRVVRRYENRNFLTAGDRIDILTLYVQKYPVSAIQRITKKGRTRIRKFLDGVLALSDEELGAELDRWYKADGREGGGA